jgi:two-component system sensor histidine kinase BaeS
VGAAAVIDPLTPMPANSITPTIATKLFSVELPAVAYVLETDEVAARQQSLDDAMACGKKAGAKPTLVQGLFGQTVQFGDASERVIVACSADELQRPGRRFVSINNAVVDGTVACLAANGIKTATSEIDEQSGLHYLTTPTFDEDSSAVQQKCREQELRAALEPYVAPQALLYLSTPQQPAPTWLDNAGGTRTVLALLAVLVVTIGLAVAGAGRILRPVRSLTRAAQRMASGDLRTRVRVHGADEVARLGETFNTMAESLERNEAQRKQLVSDVAHELRNPLANVRGYLEGAQDDVVHVDGAFVESLLEETLLLQHLIDDLQDLALAEAGRLRMHREVVDLSVLVEQTVAAHRQLADKACVSLGAVVERAAVAEVDPFRMRQVLGNLIANALRYTPPTGSVTVRLGADVADASTVRVDVVDTGVGIDPQHLPHLFDRFYRVDGSRSRGTGGSGLGLAITQFLVHAHGGTLNVSSSVGVGTTFTVRLPAAVHSDRPPERAPSTLVADD